MKLYAESEIRSLIKRFEARELPKVEWTHEAHLVVAIWYCSNYLFDEALPMVRTNITAHNTSVVTPNTDTEGYHETITKFWLLVALDFIDRHRDASITERCNRFITSEKGRSSYPLTYYSEKHLFSVKARHQWVNPDLKALGE